MHSSISRPLHPININTSTYSSLASAMTDTSVRKYTTAVADVSMRRHPKRTPVPTAFLTPSPGRSLTWPKDTAISFQSAKGGSIENGVAFSEIRRGPSGTRMLDPSGPVVINGVQPGQIQAEFRILWPGYQHMGHSCNLNIKVDGRPVTRFHLAAQIVRAYDRYFERARFWIYTGQNENQSWQIAADHSNWHLVLKSVSNRHGHEGVFQAEVDIIS